ncbi:MAG: AEC family transporter [Clostridiales bacterium]|nr:AEC family transporter [Clostridiales bacterium]
MSQLYIVFFEMAVVLAIGVVLGKKKVVDDRGRKVLNDLLLKAVLPFTILSSSQYDYSLDMLRSIGAVAAGAGIYYFLTLLTLRLIVWKTKIQDSEKRVFITTSVFANTGFVGMPLMYSLFGDAGLLLAAIYNLVYNVFFYTYGVHLLSGKKPSFMEYINPVSVSSVAAIILFVLPWRAPAALVNAIDLVGDMTFPLSMIIMGSTLATIDMKKLFSDAKSYAVCFLRMVLFPVLMTLCIILARRFTVMLPATIITLIIMTALPSGAMSVIYSERYDCAPKFAARTVTLSMVFMVITLPLVIAVCIGWFLAV